jgi:hypothetical protein
LPTPNSRSYLRALARLATIRCAGVVMYLAPSISPRKATWIGRSPPRMHSSRPTWLAPSGCWTRCSRTGEAFRRGSQDLPLPEFGDGRGVRDAGAGRAGIQRTPRLQAEQSLLGIESRGRPFRAGVASHLRIADDHDQLLEQLRSAPVSGKAHPLDGAQRPHG